jgi:hypothetical protein
MEMGSDKQIANSQVGIKQESLSGIGLIGIFHVLKNSVIVNSVY